MANLVVIDTDVLIDVGRNDKIAVARMEKEEKSWELGISIITKKQVLYRDKTPL